MAARTIPPVSNYFAGQKLTATTMNQISTWQNFWSDPPMFRMFQSNAQSIPNATWTQVACDSVSITGYDTDSGRPISTPPYSYTIPAGMTGRWEFKWITVWAFNATGGRAANLYKNGVAITTYPASPPFSSTFSGGSWGTDTIPVNAGDVMGLYAFQNSGGALNTGATAPDSQSVFAGRLVSLASP